MDVFPTLTDLCGLPTPASLDGRSLRPLLTNPQAPTAKPARGFWSNGEQTVRTDRWRLIRAPGEDGKPQLELFDYATDPQETRNHAAAQPAVVRELVAELERVPLPLRESGAGRKGK